MDHTDLQQALDYRFRDASLLELALAHSSWTNERGLDQHNERIEFLGDAVLELCVSNTLYRRFPDAREGDLTRLRSQLVNTRILARLARTCGVDEVLRLGRGEEQQGGRQRDALLADAMEAVLGGVFLDGGFDAARAVIERLFTGLWPNTVEPASRKDFKTLLQEATQRLLHVLPVYVLIDSVGPEHDKVFTVNVSLPDGRTWTGKASSVRRAEHEAAKTALSALLGREGHATSRVPEEQ